MFTVNNQPNTIVLLHFLILFLLLGCSKDDPPTVYDEDPVQQDPVDPDPDDEDIDQEIILAEDVVVILKENSEITSSNTDLESGTYIIEFTDTPPDINEDDVIIGSEGYGFLRKVSNVMTEGNIVTMETTQANLKDVFEQGTIEFSTDPDFISKSGHGNRIEQQTKDLNRADVTVLDFADVSSISPYFNIEGSVSFDPNFYLRAEYGITDDGELYYRFDDSLFNIEGSINISTPGAVTVGETAVVLFEPEPDVYVQDIAGLLELTYVVKTEVIALLSLSTTDAVDITADFSEDIILSFDIENLNGNWNDLVDIRAQGTSRGVDLEKVAGVTQNLTITERVSIDIQGITGPFVQPEMSEDFLVNYNDGSGDWDSNLNVGVNFTYGMEDEILGFGNFSNNLNAGEQIWNGPLNLVIESGDEQTGVYYGENETSPLDEPLKVLVFDSDGKPLKDVMVHYEVITGGGFIDVPDVPTNAAGFAETNWTLGNESEEQIVEATIKKADGTLIGDSPLEFKATMIDLSGTWVIVNTSSGCPEGVYYRFSFNPGSNSINIIGEDTAEITSTSFEFDVEQLYLEIGITSEEEFDYICEVDEIRYVTLERGVASINGYYSNGEFTGSYTVSFTELPINPCVYNFSCSANFRMYKD